MEWTFFIKLKKNSIFLLHGKCIFPITLVRMRESGSWGIYLGLSLTQFPHLSVLSFFFSVSMSVSLSVLSFFFSVYLFVSMRFLSFESLYNLLFFSLFICVYSLFVYHHIFGVFSPLCVSVSLFLFLFLLFFSFWPLRLKSYYHILQSYVLCRAGGQ